MFKINEFNGGHARIEWHNNIDKEICQFLHSNGQVFTTVELWPTRANAEVVLAKYPNTAPPPVTELSPHVWKHGDVFDPICNCMMIFFNPDAFNIKPRVQYISASYTVDYSDNVDFYLKDAKFLFNINDVIKERQAAKAKSWDKQEAANVVDIIDMQEFVDWAKDKSFCNSGMHICDRLANQFEAALPHLA